MFGNDEANDQVKPQNPKNWLSHPASVYKTNAIFCERRRDVVVVYSGVDGLLGVGWVRI